MSQVRTRFAPSPTGQMHVGNMRTAVFAYLAARHNGGQFILRIEDTDQERHVKGSEQQIIKSIKALGLTYDEGPDVGGAYGPYRQSQRLDIYMNYAHQLIKAGRAYPDPYRPEQVEAFRQQAKKSSQAYLYRNHRPDSLIEWQSGQPIRFKSEPTDYHWPDLVMGDLSASGVVVDDFILIKSDGYPTYNFAHVIDDHLMKINLVIRGQEFLASVPNYLNLYQALEFSPPKLATVPPVLSQTGHKKLSKRDGAKDILEYLKEGFLPEALVNFMASLGWNDGTEQEVYGLKELIEKFDITRVGRSGALFDEKRLVWLNGAHIRRMKIDHLMKLASPYWPPDAKDFDQAYKTKVLKACQDRLKFLSELPSLSLFFFTKLPVDLDLIKNDKQLSRLSSEQLTKLLNSALVSLAESDFSVDDLTGRLNQLLKSTYQKPAVLFSLIRIAISQVPASPALADSLSILGKDRSLIRIDEELKALARLA